MRQLLRRIASGLAALPRRLAVGFVRRVASRYGLVILAADRVEEAKELLVHVATYASKSGALSHPRRVKARNKIMRLVISAWAKLEAARR